MKRMQQDWQHPHSREHFELVRGGPHGVCWRSGSGFEVRMSAPERTAPVERERLSLLAVVIALLAADRPDA